MNGKAVEVHVCAKCIPEIHEENLVDFDVWEAVSKLAIKKGMPDPIKGIEPEPVEEISAKSFLIEEPSEDQKCESCGFTSEHLRKTGRLGCPNCYETFVDMLADVLTDCQKGSSHGGKVPNSMVALKKQKLKEALEEAVRSERFEEAAVLRDQLKTISG
ncbi:MAG: UvrB/UvrC motif-containing protein [Verrucomicrobiota bacterium]